MADLIDRQKAMAEAFTIMIEGEPFEIVQMETLWSLPSEQQWIPVKDRLPEDDDPVLVTDCKWWTDIAFYDGLNWWYRDSQNLKADVSAWMPLPEPYKEEDDG